MPKLVLLAISEKELEVIIDCLDYVVWSTDGLSESANLLMTKLQNGEGVSIFGDVEV